MSTFNKIYKKVANNGNDADYQVIGQVGVNGVPLDIMTGASSSADGEIGLVPKPMKGDQNKYLRADGTWQTLQEFDQKNAGLAPAVTVLNNYYGTYLLASNKHWIEPIISTIAQSNGDLDLMVNYRDYDEDKIIETNDMTTLPVASTTANGVMSKKDKNNLDNLMYWLHLPIGWYRDSEKLSSTDLAPNNGQSYTFTTSMYFNLNNPFVQEVYNDPSNHLVIMPMTNGSYHGGAHYINIDRVELHKTTDNFRVDIQFSGYMSNCSSYTDKAGFTAMFACYFKGKYVVSANNAEDQFYVIK